MSKPFGLWVERVFLIFCFLGIGAHDFDATIVGTFVYGEGIWEIPLQIFQALQGKNITINWLPIDYRVSPFEVMEKARTDAKHIGHVVLFTDLLCYDGCKKYQAVPAKSFIKIALSMLESTRIPSEWVDVLNTFFDAVIVPDSSLVEVYKISGVRRPIFCIPLIVGLDDLLAARPRRSDTVFIFGNTQAIVPRKNHNILLRAFAQVYGNNPKFLLRINGRAFEPDTLESLKNAIKELGLHNVEISTKFLSRRAYVKFLSEMNCYVSVSKGEGFSIPLREALALKVPVICTDNTAQSTICKSGFVRSVYCSMPEPATYRPFGNHSRQIGLQFGCTVGEVADALVDVCTHYDFYSNKVLCAKSWVMQYHKKNLCKLYLSVLKPKRVILGKKDEVTVDWLMTKSRQLYDKYMQLRMLR